MNLEVRNGLSGIDPAAWDALVGDGSPFLEWGWLASLEESGCVTRRDRLAAAAPHAVGRRTAVGACPLYVKGHSQGEFVFDHGWADAAAARRHPLLPEAPGRRSRSRRRPARASWRTPDADRADGRRGTSAARSKEICAANGLSSVHVNFCLPDEVEALEALGFDAARRATSSSGSIPAGRLRRLPRRLPQQAAHANQARAPRARSPRRRDHGACRRRDPRRSVRSRCSGSTSRPSTSSTGAAST